MLKRKKRLLEAVPRHESFIQARASLLAPENCRYHGASKVIGFNHQEAEPFGFAVCASKGQCGRRPKRDNAGFFVSP
jgi:hypothetical protein